MMSKKISRLGFRCFAALFLAVLQLFAVIPMNPAYADECPLYGTHQYNGELQFEAAHPHKEYYLCDCGWAQYTGTNRDYYENCEICNCDHSSETRSLWDTQTRRYDETNHVIVKVYDVICQNCGTFLRYDEEPEYVAHTWDADGKCTVCHYECEHPSETTRIVDTQIRQYDANEHVYVNILEVVCHVCGKFDRWDEETDHYESHTFDANGKCTKCNYEKPADECPVHGTHQYNGDLQYEAEHPHKEYYVCDCGWAEYTGTNHSFTTSSNLLNTRYVEYNENQHTVINVYEDVCDLCNTVVNASREEEQSDKEAHDFDADGKCTKCNYEKPADECPIHGTHQYNGDLQYEAEHPHKEYYLCDCGWAEYTGTNHSFTTSSNLLNTRYVEYNENQHTVINVYEDVCDLCNAVVTASREEEQPDKEAHDFDADGKCTKCGHQKPPVEPGQLQVSVSPTQSTAKIGETISASATASGGDGTYKYSWNVDKDGSSVDSTDSNMGAYYSYIANEPGTYVFTATVKDGTEATASAAGAEILVTCDHKNTETTEVGAPVYINNGSSGHTKGVNIHIECLDCGAVLEEKKFTSEELPHEFIGGICICGQPEQEPEPEHVHNFVNNNDFEAEHHDGLGHKMYEVCECGATRYTGEYTQWSKCCKCVGHDWGSSYDGGNGTWYHRCSRCGAEEETENTCDHKLHLIGTSTSYERLTGGKHKKIITFVYSCDCGAENKTEEDVIPEDHQLVFHDMTDENHKRLYLQCISDPDFHFLTYCYGQYNCKECGFASEMANWSFTESSSPEKSLHQFEISKGKSKKSTSVEVYKCKFCAAEQRINQSVDDITELDPEISRDKIDKLLAKSNSLVKQRYSSLAEKRDNDWLYGGASEALSVFDNPVKKLYNAATNGEKREEEYVLERAILEMLYGMEYGNSTLSESFQYATDIMEYVEKPFDVLSEYADGINETSELIIKTLGSKKEDLNAVFSSLYNPSEAMEYCSIDPKDFSARQWDEFLQKYNEQIDIYFGKNEIPDDWLRRKEALEDFRGFYGSTGSSTKSLSEKNDSAKSFGNIMKITGITADGIKTCVGCIGNALQAADETDKTAKSVNQSLIKVTSDRIDKILILTNLMDHLTPGSAIYNACAQVRKDIDNDLQGLNSTAAREMIYKNGELVTEFVCGVAVTTEIVAKSASGALDVVGEAKFVSEIITGGASCKM